MDIVLDFREPFLLNVIKGITIVEGKHKDKDIGLRIT